MKFFDFLKEKRKRKIFIWASIALFLTVCAVACAIFLGDYYRVEENTVAAFGSYDVKERVLDDGSILFGDEDAEVGFIFYPGGKVEHTAYTPLMREIAESGILCVLVRMPFNLAFFDSGAADRVRAQLPDVENWYIGGHSLGGSMAAMHVGERNSEYRGLVLLGSYSISDLSTSGIPVLSIYGSEDGVMNRDKYEECRSNLPSGFTEVVIEGGCHAYFGAYGAQDGDGEPGINVYEQTAVTAEKIIEMTTIIGMEG